MHSPAGCGSAILLGASHYCLWVLRRLKAQQLLLFLPQEHISKWQHVPAASEPLLGPEAPQAPQLLLRLYSSMGCAPRTHQQTQSQLLLLLMGPGKPFGFDLLTSMQRLCTDQLQRLHGSSPCLTNSSCRSGCRQQVTSASGEWGKCMGMRCRQVHSCTLSWMQKLPSGPEAAKAATIL